MIAIPDPDVVFTDLGLAALGTYFAWRLGGAPGRRVVAPRRNRNAGTRERRAVGRSVSCRLSRQNGDRCRIRRLVTGRVFDRRRRRVAARYGADNFLRPARP